MRLFKCLFLMSIFTLGNGDPVKINLGHQDGYWQGDILPQIKNLGFRSGKTNQLWENGIIYYELGPGSWNQKHLDMLSKAMQEIQDNTCIHFQKRISEKNFVRIENGSGCSSAVGRSSFPGAQPLSLMDTNRATCWVHDTVVHELLHSVGLYHEQMRPDRDQYIYVFMNHIDPGKQSNFEPCTTSQCSNFGVPYNYLSVMHYDITAFSSGKLATMLPKDMIFANALGNAKTGHPLDYEIVRRMYECPRKNITCYQCETKGADCGGGKCEGEVCYESVWPDRLVKGCGDAMETLVGCRNGNQIGSRNTICGCKTHWCNGNITMNNAQSHSSKVSCHFVIVIFVWIIVIFLNLISETRG